MVLYAVLVYGIVHIKSSMKNLQDSWDFLYNKFNYTNSDSGMNLFNTKKAQKVIKNTFLE